MICSRCLDLIDVPDAKFCSRCGRNLASIRSTPLDVAEARESERRLVELLSRLTEIHQWLDQRHREARQHKHAVARDLVEKRLAFVQQLEQRLRTHLGSQRKAYLTGDFGLLRE